MKKSILKFFVAGMALMCTQSVNAQVDLGNILGQVMSSGNGEEVVSSLTSVFSSKKQATAEKIVGTWVYKEPAIVLTSDNILTKAAAKVAANKAEKKIQEQLNKYGITPGALTMTFNEDGTVSETVNGKTFQGKWTVNDSKLQLTISGVKALSITTQIDGKELMFVTDATKLLNLFKSVGAKSSNSTIKTVTTLMKNVDGMLAGVTLEKK